MGRRDDEDDASLGAFVFFLGIFLGMVKSMMKSFGWLAMYFDSLPQYFLLLALGWQTRIQLKEDRIQSKALKRVIQKLSGHIHCEQWRTLAGGQREANERNCLPASLAVTPDMA